VRTGTVFPNPVTHIHTHTHTRAHTHTHTHTHIYMLNKNSLGAVKRVLPISKVGSIEKVNDT